MRNCFVANAGQAGKLAAQLKDAMRVTPQADRSRVLTDLTGGLNRVILEHEIQSISEFEPAMRDCATDNAIRREHEGTIRSIDGVRLGELTYRALSDAVDAPS